MSENRNYVVELTLTRGYEFVAEFPDVRAGAAILLDEPQPLGGNRGPNAAALLGAAVGNCLSASLAFCLHKSRVELEGLTARVVTHLVRNDDGKFRIGGIDVEIVAEAGGDTSRFDRCQDLFEDFCIVTESVRHGIPVNVAVRRKETSASVA